MAIGAIGAELDLNIRVPQDVSSVGTDDVWMARYSHPPLTTVRLPREALGQLACDALTKMLRSTRHRGLEHTLETELVVRRSTAKAADPRGQAGLERLRANA